MTLPARPDGALAAPWVHKPDLPANPKIDAPDRIYAPYAIEFHLTRVYRKLNVRGRAELARLLASEERRDRVVAGG